VLLWLQVEHGITEMVNGNVDIVEMMLRLQLPGFLAPLHLSALETERDGWAIEVSAAECEWSVSELNGLSGVGPLSWELLRCTCQHARGGMWACDVCVSTQPAVEPGEGFVWDVMWCGHSATQQPLDAAWPEQQQAERRLRSSSVSPYPVLLSLRGRAPVDNY